MRQPSRQEIIDMVSSAWREVSEDLVKRSFKLCGINNALDGSEDALVNDKMADALNHAIRDEAPEEAVGLIFDAEGLSDSEFEGFSDTDD